MSLLLASVEILRQFVSPARSPSSRSTRRRVVRSPVAKAPECADVSTRHLDLIRDAADEILTTVVAAGPLAPPEGGGGGAGSTPPTTGLPGGGVGDGGTPPTGDGGGEGGGGGSGGGSGAAAPSDLPRTITFGHDLNGNLTSISTVSSGATTKTTSFFYDARDRLTQLTLPDGRTVQNEYYPDSPLRLSFTDPGGVKTSTMWDPKTQDLVQDLDAAGAVMAEYIQGTRIDDTVGMIRGGSTYAYVGDHLNSIRALVDGSGAVQNRYRYEVFGSSRLTQEGVANRLRFTAREWEPATGTQYNRWRHYMPQIGRWTQRDPLLAGRGLLVRGLTSSRYGYVLNNPLQYTDPTGEWQMPALVGRAIWISGIGFVTLSIGEIACAMIVGYKVSMMVDYLSGVPGSARHCILGAVIQRTCGSIGASAAAIGYEVAQWMGGGRAQWDDVVDTMRGARLATNCPNQSDIRGLCQGTAPCKPCTR